MTPTGIELINVYWAVTYCRLPKDRLVQPVCKR